MTFYIGKKKFMSLVNVHMFYLLKKGRIFVDEPKKRGCWYTDRRIGKELLRRDDYRIIRIIICACSQLLEHKETQSKYHS